MEVLADAALAGLSGLYYSLDKADGRFYTVRVCVTVRETAAEEEVEVVAVVVVAGCFYLDRAHLRQGEVVAGGREGGGGIMMVTPRLACPFACL